PARGGRAASSSALAALKPSARCLARPWRLRASRPPPWTGGRGRGSSLPASSGAWPGSAPPSGCGTTPAIRHGSGRSPIPRLRSPSAARSRRTSWRSPWWAPGGRGCTAGGVRGGRPPGRGQRGPGGAAGAGVMVVRGLATGIDAAAHGGALAAGGRTVAVLATGVDGVYPPWHAGLAREVAASGALVSEFTCGTPPLPHHFPRRNRLISGLTLGTVVVEAAPGSGSLITARYALEQGREGFAVPGPVGVPLHDGPHQLIRAGATLVRGPEDVIDEIAPALRARLAAARTSAAVATLSEVETRVMDAVRAGGAHVDDVIRQTALAPGSALETLLALE